MAFTGTAVVKQISDRIVRITGLTLAAGVSGTIGLAGHTGTAPDVALPASFKTEHYAYLGSNVPFQDCVDVDVKPVASLTGFSVPAVAKSGTTTADFRITVTNSFGSTSPGLEIYVKLHE